MLLAVRGGALYREAAKPVLIVQYLALWTLVDKSSHKMELLKLVLIHHFFFIYM